MNFEITSGKIAKAQKVVVYGPEGIGKSTFVSKFPNPLFIDTEGSTNNMDVRRLPAPSSWQMLKEEVEYVKANPTICQTLIIDTADWAEQLALDQICSSKQVKGIEDIGYGKGYVYLTEEFGRLLNQLSDLIEKGINVVFTAHAMMRKFEQPDETGAYDRWELKLQKKTAPLLKEWADMLLFANYKTMVVNVDNQGAAKGKNKAQGGKRVMYTQHHPCWDAKNRNDLPEEMDFDYKNIAHIFISSALGGIPVTVTEEKEEPQKIIEEVIPAQKEEMKVEEKPIAVMNPAEGDISKLPKNIQDLFKASDIKYSEVQKVIFQRGYGTIDMPIENHSKDFLDGWLVGFWSEVVKAVNENRSLEAFPFY